jgi:predicted fused transcriptional regulator/phosphomethylpyrimidine kinase
VNKRANARETRDKTLFMVASVMRETETETDIGIDNGDVYK